MSVRVVLLSREESRLVHQRAMEGFAVLVIICLTPFCAAVGQGNPVTGSRLLVYPSATVVSPRGTNISLSCLLNTSIDTLLRENINWIYVSNAESERRQETILSERSVLIVNDTRFSLVLNEEPISRHWYFNLSILNVVDTDDGRYICRISRLNQINSTSYDEVSVAVIVPHDVEEVEIKLGDIGHRQSDVTVMCQANGSNPPPVIDIYLDNRKVVNAVVVDFRNHADQCSKGCGPRYSSALKTTIPVEPWRTIGCTARANYTGSKIVAARNVTFYTQHSCVVSPPSPHVGDALVNVSCELLHDVLHVEYYVWEVKKGDHVIRLTSNHTEEIYSTQMQTVNSTYTLVYLTLDKPDEEHLRAQYTLLLYTSLGSEERYLVQLVSGDPASSGIVWIGTQGLWLILVFCLLHGYLTVV